MDEKSSNSFSRALCDAGVAVTFICVTVLEGVSGWQVSIRRHEVFCVVLRVTEDG